MNLRHALMFEREKRKAAALGAALGRERAARSADQWRTSRATFAVRMLRGAIQDLVARVERLENALPAERPTACRVEGP